MTWAIVKATPDEDFYVAWSDNVEAPLAFGDRKYMFDWADQPSRRALDSDVRGATAARFERADRMGTSYLWPTPEDPAYRFGEGFIYEQQGWLPRTNLRALCERLSEDWKADVRDLLEPFEDEEEVRA